MLSWIPFRAENLTDTFELYGRLLNPNTLIGMGLRENTYLVAAIGHGIICRRLGLCPLHSAPPPTLSHLVSSTGHPIHRHGGLDPCVLAAHQSIHLLSILSSCASGVNSRTSILRNTMPGTWARCSATRRMPCCPTGSTCPSPITALQQHHRERRPRLSALRPAQGSRRQHHLRSHPQTRLRARGRRGHSPRLRARQAHCHGRGRQLHRRPRARQRLVRPRHPSLGVRAARTLPRKELCNNGGRHRGPVERTWNPSESKGLCKTPSPCPICSASAPPISTSPWKPGMRLLMAAAHCSPAPTTSTCTGTSASSSFTTPPMAAQCVQATSSPAAPSAARTARAGAVMLELSWNGGEPIALENSQSRSFIEDGDSLILKGWAGSDDQLKSLGEIRNPVVPHV